MSRKDVLGALMLGLFADLLGGVAKANSIAKTDKVAHNHDNSNPKAFSKAEIGVIAKEMGKEFALRITPYGNPIITHRQTKGNNIIFAFYKRGDGGIVLRRRRGYDNPFGSGNILNGGKAFATVRDAMEYFKAYKEKYPQSIVG